MDLSEFGEREFCEIDKKTIKKIMKIFTKNK